MAEALVAVGRRSLPPQARLLVRRSRPRAPKPAGDHLPDVAPRHLHPARRIRAVRPAGTNRWGVAQRRSLPPRAHSPAEDRAAMTRSPGGAWSPFQAHPLAVKPAGAIRSPGGAW